MIKEYKPGERFQEFQMKKKAHAMKMEYKKSHPVKKHKNWIAGAIKHPGALHEEMGVPEGKKIPAKALAKASKKGGKLGRRARLAETLKGMKHKKHKLSLNGVKDFAKGTVEGAKIAAKTIKDKGIVKGGKELIKTSLMNTAKKAGAYLPGSQQDFLNQHQGSMSGFQWDKSGNYGLGSKSTYEDMVKSGSKVNIISGEPKPPPSNDPQYYLSRGLYVGGPADKGGWRSQKKSPMRRKAKSMKKGGKKHKMSNMNQIGFAGRGVGRMSKPSLISGNSPAMYKRGKAKKK